MEKIDKTDEKILSCLKENSRVKASAISREISLSVSAVLERIRKLENSGVIRGYTVVTDRRKLGMSMLAILEVTLEHPRYYEHFTQVIGEMDEVASCYYMTGDFDFVLKVYARDPDHLEQIHEKVKSIQGVSGTRTYVSLRAVKEEY